MWLYPPRYNKCNGTSCSVNVKNPPVSSQKSGKTLEKILFGEEIGATASIQESGKTIGGELSREELSPTVLSQKSTLESKALRAEPVPRVSRVKSVKNVKGIAFRTTESVA